MAKTAVDLDTDSAVVTTVETSARTLQITRALGEIDTDNLLSEVSRVGGDAIWWGVLQALAYGDAQRAKLHRQVTYGQRARAIRADRFRLQEKITDAIIKEDVESDVEYLAAARAEIAADERADILRAVRTALDQKARNLERLAGPMSREHAAVTPHLSVPDASALRATMREQIKASRSSTKRGGKR